ncbi:UNVERIFIED_CONTAM: hypothetical protein GTU68_059581 [Idotea baltica]|nr:hypothetical protein [Idotea baltica]
MFVDHIKIFAKAGNGGDGCSSFRRAKFIPKGGPDGGDGGKGGDVILLVDHHTDNLKALFYNPHHKAERGANGKGQRMTGRGGKNLIIKVPPGTLVYEEEMKLVADLTEIGEKFVLLRGGNGGMGNWNYRSDTNQAPIETKPAVKGEEGWFFLELRKIADVGLVGFPNAGKSTLLRALSKATPKVAAYPFTTLKPMVGVVDFPGFMRTTIADIPGLIEGAHANVGLGHEFLRHITRCHLLMFVVDTAAVDQRDPISDIEKLRTEIKLYDEELSTRPWFIVANKADLEESEMYLTALQNRFPKQEIISISAQEGIGLDHLKERLKELVGKRPE